MPNGVVRLSRSKEPRRTGIVRDAAKQEVAEVKHPSELDLEIVVDVRSFTITHLAEPEQIAIPENTPGSSTDENQRSVLLHQFSYSYAWR